MTIDDDDIDNYEFKLNTQAPDEIDWDLNILQRPGQEQKVTKVVEEVSPLSH